MPAPIALASAHRCPRQTSTGYWGTKVRAGEAPLQAESRIIGAGELLPPKSEPGTKVGGSLAMVVAVLRASRYMFAYNGLLFVILQSIAIRRAGAIVEIAMLGLLGPALVWVGTKWGERLAHHVEELQSELVAANQTAQQEVARLKRADPSAVGDGRTVPGVGRARE